MSYDIPIVHDIYQHCEHCNVICQHHVVDYVDASYRTCTRCGTKTTLLAEEKCLKLASEKVPDPRLADDFKRDTDFKLGRPKKKKENKK